MDEEVVAIGEMEEAFKGKDMTQEPQSKNEVEDKGNDKHGRRPWQYVKIKVPAYKWEMAEGEHSTRLKLDTMPTKTQGRAAKLRRETKAKPTRRRKTEEATAKLWKERTKPEKRAKEKRRQHRRREKQPWQQRRKKEKAAPTRAEERGIS